MEPEFGPSHPVLFQHVDAQHETAENGVAAHPPFPQNQRSARGNVHVAATPQHSRCSHFLVS